MFQWSAVEIHLPQLLNEEANADEFSDWEQVSSRTAERFTPTFPTLPRFPHAPFPRPPSHPRPPSPKHHILFPNISGLEACPNASCLVIRPSFTNRCRLASIETISPPAEEYISPSI